MNDFEADNVGYLLISNKMLLYQLSNCLTTKYIHICSERTIGPTKKDYLKESLQGFFRVLKILG